MIGKATRETRFRARAARIDSTVVEADVRYPSDAVLALRGAFALAREGRKLGGLLGAKATRVVDRSRQIGRTVWHDLAHARAAHRPARTTSH